jgi:hypothetical protein
MGRQKNKEAFEKLNDIVKTTVFTENTSLDRRTVSIMQDRFNSNEVQKKLAGEVFRIKGNPNNTVKRNKSSYMFFCQEIRPDVLGKNPECKPNQTMTKLGERWRLLSDEEKAKYEIMAGEDKVRYEAEKEAQKKQTKEAQKKQNKETPRHLTSYLSFCKDMRAQVAEQHPEWTTKQVIAEVGRLWNEVKVKDPETHRLYVDRANACKVSTK